MNGIQRRFNGLTGWAGIAAVVALLSSCSSKPEDAIVGKWKELGGTETMEFFRDGTVSVVDEGMSMAGSYKFVDKDRVKVELGGLGALMGPVVARVSISGEDLSWTMPDGKVSRYKRSR
jgi:hypothetical protein